MDERDHTVDAPSGTVTFLFTDIESSTRLLEQLHKQYAQVLEEHRRILRAAFARWHGQEVDTQGDAFFVAFARATEAVGCAMDAQHNLAEHAWPEGVRVRVRMGLHTGEPIVGRTGYVGMAVHRAARIAHAGHGGQVLLSEITSGLVVDDLPSGARLVDLGRHLLKDLDRPEHIYELEIEGLPGEFPALKTIEQLPPESARLRRKVGANPYRGLFAFCESDAQFFFGRETFLVALEQVVRTQPMVAVIVGSSGSGKSSALFAGLLPRLRAEQGFQIAQLRPGSQPFYALASALLPLLEPDLTETDWLSESGKLAPALEAGEIELFQVVERLLVKTPGSTQLLLVIDQFEELYTLCPDTALQRSFINTLLQAVATGSLQRTSPLVLLLTMRADFMGQALAYRPFADMLQKTSLLMGPMTRQELHEAVERPAALQGAAFEPGLVERILDDVGESPGNLPLLQFALTLLWEQQDDGWLTHADYETIGCVDGALARYADEVYDGLDETEQSQARRIFVQLVKPGEGTEDTRRVARQDELGSGQWRLVQHLADRRLVVTGRDSQTGVDTVEVVHEALIQRWGKLQDWMQADRLFRTWQEHLRAALRQWEASKRDHGALLRGGPLVSAEEWLESRGGELAESEREFIQASVAFRASEQRQREWRRRVTFLALAVGLVIAIVLAAFAIYQRQDALRQASIGLASQAQLELEGTSPERSVLLALEALEKYPYTWQAEQVLGKIVSEFRLRHILIGHTDTVIDVAWSPDGTRIATGGNDGTIRIWDAQTYTEILKISAHPATLAVTAGVRELAWSPEGTRIATAGQEGTAKVWDAATGKEIVTFSGHTDKVWGIAWSPDGEWVASASKDCTTKVWNALTGELKFTLTGHTDWVKSVAWSPDGAWIATASDDNTARIWDATTGKERLRLSGHTNWVWTVAWSPNGTRLATASEDGTVRVWEASSGRELSDIRLASPVWQAAWSPDGVQLATTNADGRAQVWDVASGTEVFALQGHGHTPEPFDIAWSPDGKWLATTAGAGLSVRIWDASPATLTLSENHGAIDFVKWSPDGGRIATVNYLDRTVVIWDSKTGEALLIINTGDTDDLQDVYWSPDGSRIVTTSWDMLAKVWDANTGLKLLTFTGHVGEPQNRFLGRDALFGGGWSPDGSRIVTAGAWGQVRIWDARTGEEYLRFQPTTDFGTMPQWSPDGKRIATCSIPEVLQIWNAATGAPILGGYVNNTADLSFGDSLDLCNASDWSPDGSRILTTNWSGHRATIWDARTGKRMLVFTEHTSPLTLPAWSPNGKRVATGDTSGVVKVWDAATGAVLLNYSVPIADYIYNLDWSPDGTRLVDSALLPSVEIHRVWQSKEELIEYAKQCCVIRQLTPQERQQFGLQ